MGMVVAHNPLTATALVPYGSEQRRRVDFKTVCRIVCDIDRGQNADNARFSAEKQSANLFIGRLCGFSQNSLPCGS